MNNIGSGIRSLYPTADPFKDFCVRDDADGRGPKVTYWDTSKLGPMPELAVLESAGVQAVKDAVSVKATKTDRRTAILALDPKEIKDPALRVVVEFLQMENRP